MIMRIKKPKFIIYTPSFDESSGGIIALHRLCDLLNRHGEKAFVVPSYQKSKCFVTNIIRGIKHCRRMITLKALHTPILYNHHFISNSTIVIYPEIIDGNPLNAKNTVRWLLHKPGFHTGRVNFGKNDLFFFYQEIFNDIELNPHKDNLLKVTMLRDDLYKQINYGKRSSSCYMLRKGKGKKIVHDLKDSVLLDGKAHIEIAEIMNQCTYFISYDTETLYSQYAVLCGCISIVVPIDGKSKEQWQPVEKYRYGVAYGFDDIEEAQATAHLLYNVMKEDEVNSNESVTNFINFVYKYYNFDKIETSD